MVRWIDHIAGPTKVSHMVSPCQMYAQQQMPNISSFNKYLGIGLRFFHLIFGNLYI